VRCLAYSAHDFLHLLCLVLRYHLTIEFAVNDVRVS